MRDESMEREVVISSEWGRGVSFKVRIKSMKGKGRK
jgi:hypothetical protein